MEYSQKAFCKKNNGTFVLIDGSDPINKASRKWIAKNIFLNRKLTHFQEEGGLFAASYMAEDSVADIEMQNVCSPKPQDKVNIVFESPDKNKRMNFAYNCAIKHMEEKALTETTRTGKSLLVEAIREIFSNPRYGQVELKGKRKFVLVSDLFQNSSRINFYKLCRRNPSGARSCPSYSDLINAGGRTADYLRAATPKLRVSDEIYIWNINIQGRTDQSAKEFWIEYFVSTGVPRENIHYRVELDRH